MAGSSKARKSSRKRKASADAPDLSLEGSSKTLELVEVASPRARKSSRKRKASADAPDLSLEGSSKTLELVEVASPRARKSSRKRKASADAPDLSLEGSSRTPELFKVGSPKAPVLSREVSPCFPEQARGAHPAATPSTSSTQMLASSATNAQSNAKSLNEFHSEIVDNWEYTGNPRNPDELADVSKQKKMRDRFWSVLRHKTTKPLAVFLDYLEVEDTGEEGSRGLLFKIYDYVDKRGGVKLVMAATVKFVARRDRDSHSSFWLHIVDPKLAEGMGVTLRILKIVCESAFGQLLIRLPVNRGWASAEELDEQVREIKAKIQRELTELRMKREETARKNAMASARSIEGDNSLEGYSNPSCVEEGSIPSCKEGSEENMDIDSPRSGDVGEGDISSSSSSSGSSCISPTYGLIPTLPTFSLKYIKEEPEDVD